MPKKDSSTQNKIKEAAKKLFTESGYGRITTRDIAQEAGVNLALVNYHFRSKEELFSIIMMEVLTKFLGEMRIVLNDEHTFEEKVEILVSNYIDMLTKQPDLPIFIMSEIRNHPERLADVMGIDKIFSESSFFRELAQRTPEGENPVHYFLNLVSMTVFPFIAKPILMAALGQNSTHFDGAISARKTLIPQWFNAMLNHKNHEQ